MKKLLLILLLLPVFAEAQNWQCLQGGVKHYFTDSIGYLRGIRIDSVRATGDTAIYYPFHTTRGTYMIGVTLDTNGGSWLGKRVLQLTDGSFLFDNIWQHPTLIKTHAHVGDTWTFYSDTTQYYYKATLISADTMTVSGGLDSIKTIQINAYTATGANTTDLMNNFKIVLSKNNGFVSVFDLYTFPYHRQDTAFYTGIDYYMDYLFGFYGFTSAYLPTATNIQFSLVPLINPTYENLYDWNVGDVFENSIFSWSYSNDGSYPYGYYFDSITSKTVMGDSIVYGYTGWLATQHFPFNYNLYPDYYSLNYPYDTTSTSGALTYHNQLLIDTTVMPEEKNTPYLQYYFPNDTSYCLRSSVYRFIPSNIIGTRFQPGGEVGMSITYKTGPGLLNFDNNILGGSPPFIDDTTLLYYVRGGTSCGYYTTPHPLYNPLAVPGLVKADISIYPNPATSQLTITAPDKITTIVISNIVGQTVYSRQYNALEVQVDVAGLPAGVYFVKVNGTEVRRFVKE